MANAAFNPTGSGGLDKVEPATDGRLAAAVVRTLYREAPPRTQRIVHPGISGAISIEYGLATAEIVWEWTLEAASYSDLAAFEDLLRAYRGAGRFTLQSEIDGVYWDNVEFRRYEPEHPPDRLPGGNWLRSGRVYFEWMQPTGG